MIDKRNVRNLYPLTPLQEGMLFHALHQPDSRAYFERLEYGLEGAIDIDAWRGAWQDLTDRHDILRTLFAVRNTPRPLQVVLREVPAPVEWHDLSADDEAGARARIEAWKAFAEANPRHTEAIFLDAAPAADTIATATGLADERIALGRREIYVEYPGGQGRPKLSLPASRTGTARNMNTVARMAELAAELEATLS